MQKEYTGTISGAFSGSGLNSYWNLFFWKTLILIMSPEVRSDSDAELNFRWELKVLIRKEKVLLRLQLL
jgi:hypothetical protein